MTKLGLLSAVLLSSLAFTTMACSASDAGDDTASAVDAVSSTKSVHASNAPEHGRVSGLWAVKNVETVDGVTLRVYEMGGGDPAMNGNHVWLGASDPNGDSGMYDLNINIASITKVEATGTGMLRLVGAQDTIDDEGAVQSKAYEATIHYDVVNEVVGEAMRVTTPTHTHEARRATEEDASFLARVFSARTVESSERGHIARVFESTAGDPAMNGVSVFLSLMAYPEERTFDLGLNVAGITSLRFTTDDELRIDGSEDLLDAEGSVTQRPVAYSVKFTVDPGGNVSEIVKMTKL